MWVKPTDDPSRAVVRCHLTKRILPPEGMEVQDHDVYWLRRIAHGDVIQFDPAAPAEDAHQAPAYDEDSISAYTVVAPRSDVQTLSFSASGGGGGAGGTTASQDEANEKPAEPTPGFRFVGPDEVLPMGSHVRMNVTTGRSEVEVKAPEPTPAPIAEPQEPSAAPVVNNPQERPILIPLNAPAQPDEHS